MFTVTPRIIRSGDCRGYDRIIVQLDGPPMALAHAGRPPVALEHLVPHAFSGRCIVPRGVLSCSWRP